MNVWKLYAGDFTTLAWVRKGMILVILYHTSKNLTATSRSASLDQNYHQQNPSTLVHETLKRDAQKSQGSDGTLVHSL